MRTKQLFYKCEGRSHFNGIQNVYFYSEDYKSRGENRKGLSAFLLIYTYIFFALTLRNGMSVRRILKFNNFPKVK